MTLPATTTVPRSKFMVTEVQTDSTTQNDVPTVPLNNIRHLAPIADIAMRSTPGIAQGPPVYNEVANAQDIRFRIWVKSSVNYILRNQSTDLVRVRVYYFKARQDFNLTNWKSGVTNVSNMFNIYNQLARGFAANGIDPGNFTPDTSYAMSRTKFTPYDSILFMQNWKMFKSRVLLLRPGAIKNFQIRSRPFSFRPFKYLEMYGSGSPTFRVANPVYNHMRYEKFCLFQIDSSPAGYGAAQTGVKAYSKVISHTTPTTILETHFRYKFNTMWAPHTPFAVIEEAGFSAPAATANTIVNVEEGILGEEKDAE